VPIAADSRLADFCYRSNHHRFPRTAPPRLGISGVAAHPAEALRIVSAR